MEAAMGDLLPCPFCGGEAKAQHLHDSFGNSVLTIANIGCNNGCVHQSGFREKAVAIAAWNRRALPAAPAEDVRAVADGVERMQVFRAGKAMGREEALKEAAEAWEAFKTANTTVDHWKAVERLNAALEAKP
jgi:Lar family restriction alleviation protein